VTGLKEKAKEYYDRGYAVALGSVGGRILEQAQWLRGLSVFMEDLAINVEFAVALMDKLVALQKDFFCNVLDEVGEYLSVVCMGDDLSTQQSLFMSPQMYRQLIKPRHAELYGFVKERCKARIMHHSCGAVYPLIRDLIEVGVDILNPVQPLARCMDRANIKKEFGKEICFWGGVDEQYVLPFGDIHDVEKEVKLAVSTLGKNGGYILSAAHNIQPDVKAENILTMYKTCREMCFGKQ
jgi:uroporphyrinogen decarboxylase